jgi:hypothetical protein
MKVKEVAPADGEPSRRLVGTNRDIRHVAELQTVITICTITMLMTGCMLPPLPGFRVAADGQSSYYNDGPYYDNTPYYNNAPYDDDRPYNNGPYANRRYYNHGGY